MVRTRTGHKKTVATSSSEKETPSIQALFEKAKSLLTQCDYDLAQKLALRILQREPSNGGAKELLGVTQLEKGQLEEAKQTFQALLPPDPDAPDAPDPPFPSAHLYLAQLNEDEPYLALKHYEAAVGILHGQLKGKERASGNAGESESDIRANIVRVLVAMVEIWMSPTYDLCFDPKAEEICDALLKSAFETDPDNMEAFICLSSFRLSQQRPEDARDAAMTAWMSFKDEDDVKMPPIPMRIELAKRFIEISEFAPALAVLQSIMASDDQEVEAWYLEGWCFFLMAEQAKETGVKIEGLSWEELARDARECLENCRMLHTSQQHPDDKLLEHTVELIGQLDAIGIEPVLPDDDDLAADGWEDVDDSDDDIEMS